MTVTPVSAAGAVAAEEAQTLDRLSLVGQDITASFVFADIFAAIERHLGALLNASTLYIGLLDETGLWIEMPLFVDGGRRVPGRRIRVDDPKRPASQCIREGAELLKEKTLAEAVRDDLPGTTPTLTALFRPLVVQGRTIGMMSIQSQEPRAYGERERLIFRTLCSYAAVALANAESFRRLAALRSLEVLGEVGQEVTASLRLDDLLAALERHMGRLFELAGFALALPEPHRAGSLAIQLDVEDGRRRRRAPIDGHDPDAPEAAAFRDGTEMHVPGPPLAEEGAARLVALHRPLTAGERVLGVLSIRSIASGGFGEQQVLLFRSLCAYVAIALANVAAFREAEAARAEADATLADLRRAQEGLIEAEKMASLGQLVAGVAHEVNTPVGTSLTIATSLERLVGEFRGKSEGGALRRSDLTGFVGATGEAARQLAVNLTRASDLVRRFKEVAADRTRGDQRPFLLDELVGAILTSLTSELRRFPHRLEVEIPPGLAFDSFPGALGQILINLVMNAMVHAFPPGRAGRVVVRAREAAAGLVALTVQDDGTGIPEGDQARIFEPFFTTRRDQGGTGLGLHIAYNLAVQTLQGRLTVASRPGCGATFALDIPTRIGPAPPSLGGGRA